jgi:chemotaxis protein CheC
MSVLSSYQRDVLTELFNIGVGRAAGILNQMVDGHVDLLVPELTIFESGQDLLDMGFFDPERKISTIRLDFQGDFSGVAALVFPWDSAGNLVSALAKDCVDAGTMDSLRIGMLEEIGNIVLNGVMGSMSNMLNKHMEYRPPLYFEDTLQRLLQTALNSRDQMIVFVRTHFLMPDREISGDIMLFFKVEAFAAVLEAIDSMAG